MNHADHVDLLRKGIPSPGGVWADFGAGRGAFTLALAEVLGEGGQITAVDRDRRALDQLDRAVHTRYPEIGLDVIEADFSRPLKLPQLDGIVMANSIHFFIDKEPVLALVQRRLMPGGRLIVVEYDTDQGNQWVPYPISYVSWEAIAAQVGFKTTRLLATKPSGLLGRFYSALSM